MPEGGSSIFTDADGYQAVIQDILDLLVLQPRAFHARLTWVDLPNLQLLRAKEASARVGVLRLPVNQVFVTFVTGPGSALYYNDMVLEFGSLMLHSRGEVLHQRTTGPCEWASIAITPAALSRFGRTLAGRMLAAPATGQFVQPRRADGRRLERLHRRVCNAVERKLDSISNREVVRTFEQDLISALISCLAYGTAQQDRQNSEKGWDVLPAFEALLAKEPFRLWRTREICSSLGISEAALRAKCALALGMSPNHYQRLRRLKLLRTELLQEKPCSEPDIEETVVRYGFSNLHRFVTEYWHFYGEMPPIRPLAPADR
jgi:AraC-like DNA-binding protein